MSQLVATPTEVMSPGEVGRGGSSSVEETLTNQTLTFSPAPSVTPTATPTAADIIRQEEGPGGSQTRIQTDPGSGDDESVSLQQVQQVANELRQTARRAVHLYQQLGVAVGGSERRLQMASVLQGAFDVVHSELAAVLRGGGVRGGGGGGAPSSGGPEDDGTMSLLERYSELLVQMTQNKLNRI